MPSPRRPVSSRASFLLQASIATAGTLLAFDASADIDLTGRWRAGAGSYANIVQTGGDVTLTLGADTYTGTFDQTVLSVTVPSTKGLSLHWFGDGTLDGNAYTFGYPSFSHARLTRCECYDANESSGDGCDSECRVEPCYTCTPEPSTCTPSADGETCDDRDDCTTGETCSSGSCENGVPLAPCVNLTGTWQVVSEVQFFYDGSKLRYQQTTPMIQRNGLVRTSGGIGPVNSVTGEIELTYPTSYFRCGSRTDSGTATLDNLAFSLTGVAQTASPTACFSSPTTIEGRRCDEAAGCDLADCTGHADGTPCNDSNLCTVADSCQAGTCKGKATCSACEACDPSNGSCAENTPRTDCLKTRDATSTFQIRNWFDAEKDRIKWIWSHGEAFDAAALGLTAPNDLTLCIFGANAYQTTLVSDSSCAKPPCWTADDRSAKYRNDSSASPIVSMSLSGGSDGRTRIRLSGKGALLDTLIAAGFTLPLPAVPLATPIVTQLQSSAGACFEASFDDTGLKTNEGGKFSAKGGNLD